MNRNAAPFSIGRLVSAMTRIPLLGRSRDEFHINLSSRYRSATAPIRTVLVLGCVFLGLGILWSIGQTGLGYREVRTISAELDRIRQQDTQLIAEARQEGIDLSEGVLQGLPAEAPERFVHPDLLSLVWCRKRRGPRAWSGCPDKDLPAFVTERHEESVPNRAEFALVRRIVLKFRLGASSR